VPDVRTFAVLSPFVGGDYYGAVIAGVNRAAVAAGDRVIAMQTLDPGSHSADYGMPDFRQPIAWRYLDGVVAMPGAVSPGYAQALRDIGVPVVLIGHELPGVQCPVVLADNRAGVGDAVRHLVRHGYERIAFGGNLAAFDVRERHEGYLAGLADFGIDPDHHDGTVEALLVLRRRGVAGQRSGPLGRHHLQLLQVDDQPRGRLRGAAGRAVGQQLGHRDGVEVGQLGQPLHGHRPVAALVGADHDRLPAALGLLLHPVQGQPLLGADGSEPSSQRPRVLGRHPWSALPVVTGGDRWCGACLMPSAARRTDRVSR